MKNTGKRETNRYMMMVRILSFIRNYQDMWGDNPTMREIGNTVFTSVGNVYKYILVLKKAGWITTDPIQITVRGYNELERYSPTPKEAHETETKRDTTRAYLPEPGLRP